jgi:hypothetical protein
MSPQSYILKEFLVAKKALANAANAGSISSAPAVTRSTRVRTAKPVAEAVNPAVVSVPEDRVEVVDAHSAIATIAYGYWEARGGNGGSMAQDWLLAEKEYYSSLA